jgi:hypothetical protein
MNTDKPTREESLRRGFGSRDPSGYRKALGRSVMAQLAASAAVVPERRATRWRPEMPAYSREASGDIYPSRFVSLDTTQLGNVKQAGAGQQIYGISQSEPRGFPKPGPSALLGDPRAAAQGDNVFIYGPPAAQVPLAFGGPVKIGDRLKSDQNGMGIKATSLYDECGAIAEEAGPAGYVGLVTLLPPERLHGANPLLA